MNPHMNSNASRVAVVAGVGEGVGLAVSRRFAKEGFLTVMLARNEKKVDEFAQSIRGQGGKAVGLKTDLREESEITSTLSKIEAEIGPIDAAIYNAGAAHRMPALEITGDTFEKVWRLGCFGAFVFGRECIRHMLPRGRGTLLFTGATASLRGGANFSAFAAAKFGTRAVTESLAREFGPQGIHVATVIIDGAVDMPAIHRRMPDLAKSAPPDGLLNTDAIADTYFMLHSQKRSAWTLQADLRPYSERF